MKIAEGGSKKKTPRKWQSNHLLCLHWQQSVTQSSQRKSSSTARVCRGILPTPRGTRHKDISGSGTLKGSSEKCLAAQHTTKHTQQAQGSQQHRLIANNCMSLRVLYPQNAESCEESCQQQAVGTPQQQNCWGRRGVSQTLFRCHIQFPVIHSHLQCERLPEELRGFLKRHHEKVVPPLVCGIKSRGSLLLSCPFARRKHRQLCMFCCACFSWSVCIFLQLLFAFISLHLSRKLC